MEENFSYQTGYRSMFDSKDSIGNIEMIVAEVAKEQGFLVESLPDRPGNYVVWAGGCDMMLRKDGTEYRFFNSHHDAEFEENNCLAREDFIFYLNQGNITDLRLRIVMTGYSDHDGDISGISNVNVECLLASENPLPVALYEKLKPAS